MKNLRTILAVTAGLLVAVGYVLLVEKQQWNGHRPFLGLMFGSAILWGFLKEPERSLNQVSIAVNAFLASPMILREVFNEPVERMVWIILFCLAVCGTHFLLVRLYQKEDRERVE